MKIYLVSRTDKIGWDEYIEWIVVAKSPKQARSLCEWADGKPEDSDLKVTEIKVGKRPRTILGSFNAG